MLHHTIQDTDVPALGFGTYRLQGADCRRAVADALSMGYRHIDTATMYGNEEAVGAGLRDAGIDRDEVFLTTKLWLDQLTPARVAETVGASLRRLGVERVDLLLIHWPNADVPLTATLDAMLEERDAGRVRHVGVSNFPPSLLEDACRHAPVFCNQVEYHPLLAQQRLRTLSAAHDILLTAYRPLAGGALFDHDTVQRIARARGKTPAQVVLRWHVQQPRVAAIPKAASPEHRRANLDVFDFRLTDDEMRAIHALDRGDRMVDPGFAPDWDG